MEVEIQRVKRLTDHIEFNIGDKINVLISHRVKKPAKIISFQITTGFNPDPPFLIAKTEPPFCSWSRGIGLDIEDIELR